MSLAARSRGGAASRRPFAAPAGQPASGVRASAHAPQQQQRQQQRHERQLQRDQRRDGGAQPPRQQQPLLQQQHQQPEAPQALSRRQLAQAACALAAAAGLGARPAAAFTMPPDGFKAQVDKLDGYSFVYPEQWTPVTSSGNDIFLRNPFNVDQNLFVDISSPSSSRFSSVADLGSPEDAASRLLDQYLNKEFMSTRLGIRREGQVVGAAAREQGGRTYYDIEIRMASYASRSPYVATQSELMRDYGLEWDRRFLTTLGVANKRLYELRLQTGSDTYEQDKPQLDLIRGSFKVVEVEA